MNNMEKTLINLHLRTVSQIFNSINDAMLGLEVCSYLYKELFYNTVLEGETKDKLISMMKG